jgi:hypothetical protein
MATCVAAHSCCSYVFSSNLIAKGFVVGISRLIAVVLRLMVLWSIVLFSSLSYSQVNIVQSGQKLPGFSGLPSILKGCSQRIQLEADGSLSMTTISGRKIEIKREGKKISSVSNGLSTASVEYVGKRINRVVMSDGRSFNFRTKLSKAERRDLPRRLNRVNKLVATAVARECMNGSLGAADGEFIRASDGGGEWDTAWETQEFWDIWAAERLPPVVCTTTVPQCTQQCDQYEKYAGLGCGALSAAAAIVNPWLGIIVMAGCGVAVIEYFEVCRLDCELPWMRCG